MSAPTNESGDENVMANSSEKNVIKEESRKRKHVEDEFNDKDNVVEEENAEGNGNSTEEDESAKENDRYSPFSDCHHFIMLDDSNVGYYEEDDLPNFNFRKFDIPRVPASVFPADVLKHMKMNSQPRTELKLMQISKYFCDEEFPFLPMKYIKYYEDYGFGYETLEGHEVDYTDSRILKLFEKKLWMTFKINLDYKIPIQFFLRFIAACDLQELYLQNQYLSIEEFKFLTFGGKIKKFSLRSVSLNYDNDDPDPIEEILKHMPNVEEFCFSRWSIYHENVSNFISILNTEKLNYFALGALTEKFDFETFIDFFTKYPKIQFSLRFKKGIPDEYFTKLQNFVENTRKAGSYSRYVFSRIFCNNQTWRYGGADEWYNLPTVSCKCNYGKTLYSNYDPPYFRCSCGKYLMLKTTKAWNKQFHKYYE